jgi:HME family heavy-metal exporter
LSEGGKTDGFCNRAVGSRRRAFGRAMIIRGSQERLVPVLMTAASAGCGLLPLVIQPYTPGKEILFPVAVTILGGLITATILDALLTPVMFLRF